MKHLCLAFLGCSLVTLPTPVDHASLTADGTNAKSCESRTMIMSYLSAEYAEKPVAMGVAENGGLIEVLSSRDGSTFTITVTSPGGQTCMVAAGKSWELLARAISRPSRY